MSAPEPLRTFQTGRQIGIYRAGKRIDPGFIPLAVEDLERKARSLLSAEAYDWIAGSAGGGATARANLAAFERWGIVPRMLCDVSNRDFGVSLFGDRLPVPLLVAPIGVQAAAHPEGEKASAGDVGRGDLVSPGLLPGASGGTMLHSGAQRER
jgi:lactate 2-monooxygenase